MVPAAEALRSGRRERNRPRRNLRRRRVAGCADFAPAMQQNRCESGLEILKPHLDAAELEGGSEGAPSAQRLIETDRERDRSAVGDRSTHANDVIDVFPDCTRLHLREAGVEEHTTNRTGELLEERSQRLGFRRARPAAATGVPNAR